MTAAPGQFVGRQSQLALLEQDLTEVERSRRGRFVMLRGRRRVGKSRLVSEFLRRHQIPTVFYAATPASPERELVRFTDAVGRSTVPAAQLVRSGTSFGSWEAALSTVALSAGDSPIVIVIDELPYLVDGRRELEAQLQHVWDQVLEHRPVLLIAIGSDLAMMAALTSHGRPLFGRPTREIVLNPLTVAEVGDLLGLAPAEAIDAALVVGGFPLVAQSWPQGLDRREFLQEALKLTRLRIADPYLRFWLRFVEPGMEEIERGRADLAFARVEEGWLTYRGVAVEPIVRDALDRLVPDPRFGAARYIGSYWTRAHDTEVDLVGLSDMRAGRVEMVGSVTWRENAPFDSADHAALLRSRDQVPGTDSSTILLAVSRTGIQAPGVDIALGPTDLIDAWR